MKTFSISSKPEIKNITVGKGIKHLVTTEYCLNLPKGSKLPRLNKSKLREFNYYLENLGEFYEDKFVLQIIEEQDYIIKRELYKIAKGI